MMIATFSAKPLLHDYPDDERMIAVATSQWPLADLVSVIADWLHVGLIDDEEAEFLTALAEQRAL